MKRSLRSIVSAQGVSPKQPDRKGEPTGRIFGLESDSYSNNAGQANARIVSAGRS